MSDIAELGYRVDTSGLVKGEQALNKMRSAGDRVEKGGKGLIATYGKLAGAIATVTAIVGGAVTAYARYETALAEVNTLLGADQNINDYSKSIRELSKQFGTDQAAQAKAFYQVISAGASSAAEASSIMTAANKLAIGGVTDITTASDGLTSVLNAYSLDASKAGEVSDILFATMKSGKTTIGELSGNLGKVAPIASQLGVGLDELNASIAVITKGGVSTSEAVTQIRAALSNVLKPSKEASDLAAELGINFSASGLKAQGFAGFIQEVAEKTGGSDEKMSQLFGSIEAVQAIMPLAGSKSQEFADILGLVSGSAGATDEAFGKMSGTLTQKFLRAVAIVKDFGITIGKALSPTINLLTDSVLWLLNALSPVVSLFGQALSGLQMLAVGAFNLYVEFQQRLIGAVVAFFDLISNNAFSRATDRLRDMAGVVGGELAFAFENANLVGIALVRGTLIGVENMRYGFGVAAEFIKFAFNKSIDILRAKFASFFETLSRGLKFAGFEDMASGLDGVISKMKGAQSSTDDYNKATAELKKQKDAAIKSIITITDEMVDFEIQTKQANDAIKKQEEVSKKADGAHFDFAGAIKGSNDKLKGAQDTFAEASALLDSLKGSTKGVADEQDNLGGVVTTVKGLWERANDSMFNSLQSFYNSGLKDTKNFAANLKDTFKDMISSLLAEITRLIASNVFKKFLGFLGIGGTKNQGIGLFDGLGSFFGDTKDGQTGGFDLSSIVTSLTGIGTKVSGAITSLFGGTAAASGVAVGGAASAGAAMAAALASAGSAGVAVGGAAGAGAAMNASLLAAGTGGIGSSIIGALGPVGVGLAAAFAAYKIFGGGARSFEEIMEQDIKKSIFGSQMAGEAIGANGATGFNGGNTGILGANFGISGTGLVNQLLTEGGANGGIGYFSGAQKSLEGFSELLKQNGVEARIAGGILEANFGDKPQQMILDLWQSFRDGIGEAVGASDVFRTAFENNLIQPTNLFYENMTTAFGQSAFEARDSLMLIDNAFDALVASGTSSTDALFKSISDHYGVSLDEAKHFVDASGVALNSWVDNFSNASGDALRELLDFNAEGITSFESGIARMGANATTTFDAIEQRIQGVSNSAVSGSQQVENAYTGAVNRAESNTNSALNRLADRLKELVDNSSVTRGAGQPLAGM